MAVRPDQRTERPARVLVVNADDFGFTAGVNAGIIEAHERGIVTATTLMANSDAFDDAVRLARACPSLDVGCHLVLVQGPGLPDSVAELIVALARRRLRPYEILRSQIERIFDAGIRPLHLDTHKHTHLLPPVLDAVARLSAEFGIPWVRRPFDFGTPQAAVPAKVRAVNRGLQFMRPRFRRVLERDGCRTTDHFTGFQITGRISASELAALIRALPEGVTELMCHPGHCTEELRQARTRLKESRELELGALTAPEVKAALQETGVALSGYRGLQAWT
ncbi:MAG TPA: ChbG/HpnK family deacetylase [Bryobacteraceae bacterium]|nr:ChbG/HpnK family deacetylase [Bryobacteraceae bacterium]